MTTLKKFKKKYIELPKSSLALVVNQIPSLLLKIIVHTFGIVTIVTINMYIHTCIGGISQAQA